MTKIYIASKTVHAYKWKAFRANGAKIISTWIDEAGAGESASLTDLWLRCIHEASNCDVLIAYREPGEILKGAFIEIGAALASNIPVYCCGDFSESFVAHPLVQIGMSVETAFKVNS